MEKLSSILPGNSRVTSVDLETGPPVRPGAPAFGRKVGQNTIKDKVTLSNQAKEMALQDSLAGRRDPKEVSRAKMVEDINRKFFETRLQKPVIEENQMNHDANSEVVSDRELANLNLNSVKDQISQYESQQPTSQASVTPQMDIEA